MRLVLRELLSWVILVGIVTNQYSDSTQAKSRYATSNESLKEASCIFISDSKNARQFLSKFPAHLADSKGPTHVFV